MDTAEAGESVARAACPPTACRDDGVLLSEGSRGAERERRETAAPNVGLPRGGTTGRRWSPPIGRRGRSRGLDEDTAIMAVRYDIADGRDERGVDDTRQALADGSGRRMPTDGPVGVCVWVCWLRACGVWMKRGRGRGERAWQRAAGGA